MTKRGLGQYYYYDFDGIVIFYKGKSQADTPIVKVSDKGYI